MNRHLEVEVRRLVDEGRGVRRSQQLDRDAIRSEPDPATQVGRFTRVLEDRVPGPGRIDVGQKIAYAYGEWPADTWCPQPLPIGDSVGPVRFSGLLTIQYDLKCGRSTDAWCSQPFPIGDSVGPGSHTSGPLAFYHQLIVDLPASLRLAHAYPNQIVRAAELLAA